MLHLASGSKGVTKINRAKHELLFPLILIRKNSYFSIYCSVSSPYVSALEFLEQSSGRFGSANGFEKFLQKLASIDVLRKRFCEDMQQIFRMFFFSGCFPINVLNIFRTTFAKNTSTGLFLFFWNTLFWKPFRNWQISLI